MFFLTCEKWTPDEGESCESGRNVKVVVWGCWSDTWLDGTIVEEKGRSLWRAISNCKNLGTPEGLRLYIPWECQVSAVFIEQQDV